MILLSSKMKVYFVVRTKINNIWIQVLNSAEIENEKKNNLKVKLLEDKQSIFSLPEDKQNFKFGGV